MYGLMAYLVKPSGHSSLHSCLKLGEESSKLSPIREVLATTAGKQNH